MAYSFEFNCFPQMVPEPPRPQFGEAHAQWDYGVGNTPAPVTLTDRDAPRCCEKGCGKTVPLVVNGSYTVPMDGEKAYITFNVHNSPSCGIPVASVLNGELGDLDGRDDLAELTRPGGSKSMRMRIQLPGYETVNPKINFTPIGNFKVENLLLKVCKQIQNFITNAEGVHVGDGPTPEWTIGAGGISIEKLVLVSLKRVSAGTWVPCIRLMGRNDL